MPARESRGSKKRWIRKVATESTFPEKGIFTRNAETIARHVASKKVSPKGVGSGIRMIQYFLNRAGKGLPDSRRRELEKAKRMLQSRKSRQARAR
jgi:tRNA(adenine34) deaminase